MRRVFTALVLIPSVLSVVLLGPFWLVLGVTAVVALLCYFEYGGIAAAYGYGSPRPLGYLAGIAVLLAAPQDLMLVWIGLVCVSLGFCLREPDLGKALPRAAVLIAGVAYVFGCWKFALMLEVINRYWLLFGLALCWIGDIGAYYVGRRFGARRLAPRVSPGKSWEGAAASVIASVLFGYLYLARLLPGVPAASAIGISAAANVAGQFGDLAESAIKRGAGLKDSGALLPGHGGFLDRVDSTLFALPVVYLCVRLMGTAR
jgi:phosphatidate cytidylyltransferase